MLEVDAERASAPLDKIVEVAAGLRRLDDAKAVGVTGHDHIGRVVAGDLKEHAGIRAALVGLPGRVLEAGAKSKTGRGMRLVANTRTQGVNACVCAASRWMYASSAT